MPQVGSDDVTAKLRRALDAQGRVQEAARNAAAQADAARLPKEPPAPEPERKP